MIRLTMLLIGCSILFNSCILSNHNYTNQNNPNIDNAIQTLSYAIEPCEQEQKMLPRPSEETLRQINEIPKEVLVPYLKYKSHVNFQFCLINHGAIPNDYFTKIIIQDDVDLLTKQKATHILNLNLPNQLTKDIDIITQLSEKDRKKLYRISYLNENFDLLILFEELELYRDKHKNIN